MGKLLDNKHRRRAFHWQPVLIAGGFLFLIGCGYWLWQANLFGKKPFIERGTQTTLPRGSQTDKLILGKTGEVELTVSNEKGGLCSFEVTLKQADKSLLLLSQKDLSLKSDPFKTTIKTPAMNLVGVGFVEGEVLLESQAKSCALFKKTTQWTQSGLIDLAPPQIGLTSTQHYINQGGADLIMYTVSPDTVWSGVRVGSYTFKGYKKPGGSDAERFALIVYSYDLPAGTPLELVARDAAGNQASATVAVAKFFSKQFRRRDLPVDDVFIQTKVADIINNTPELKRTGDLLKDYLMVNRDLRKKNAQDLVALSEKSEEKFLWKGAFTPLTNAAVEANFADYRSYVYNGQKVDEQVHLGFDLAVTKQYPIAAGNRGRVLFAGYLGIYGNTVVLDHGYGLTTLYGHLSSMDVKAGDLVERGHVLGKSGETGLAGGDHLHFSMLIGGVQTNPVEFWDQHWIEDHVYLRIPQSHFGAP